MIDGHKEGYIVEFYAVGKSVKVTAFDPATLHEVSIIGTARASRKDLAELAIRKLQYVQNKENSDKEE